MENRKRQFRLVHADGKQEKVNRDLSLRIKNMVQKYRNMYAWRINEVCTAVTITKVKIIKTVFKYKAKRMITRKFK